MKTAFTEDTRNSIGNLRDHSKSRAEIYESQIGIPSSVRFSYLNNRPKSYAIVPSTKVFSRATSTSHNLGPGKYSIKDSNPGPSFEFSKASRFSKDSIIQFMSRRSSKRLIKSKEKLEVNKNLSQFTPIEKSKKMIEIAKKNKVKAEIIKITKFNIIKEKQDLREQKIKEKYMRLELRKRIGEIREIKISWILLKCIVGCAYVIRNYINNRTSLRKRTALWIKKLQQLVICIGKIRIILKRNRKKKAIKVKNI
jgi:hypothetical protein